ncbi:cytochrome b [Sphingomonas sp.]|uniref:cytochrome b n=1 Tax=Sphingomonas sp. TaxID=28214 RepID=UPI002CFA9AE0|nr:cytochrome b [Sphingomonas sp.]HTG38750.1 cytochrome b [Sphingomonas sp.]
MDGNLRYDGVARALHWTMAALIILNLLAGLFHDALEGVVEVMPLHKATGILILALTLVRIGWRLTHRPPPAPASSAAWERGSAHAVHMALYALMLAMPISGWIMSSGGQYPISFYGLFEVPKFAVTRDDALWGVARQGHEVMGLTMLALAALHIAAALRHHFLLKDGLLRRMA